MKDVLKEIEKLGSMARLDKAPDVNVSGRVMAAVRAQGIPGDYPLPGWMALVSAAAACAAVIGLIPVYLDWSDPVIAIIVNLSWGLL
jgi:hypothetical protein